MLKVFDHRNRHQLLAIVTVTGNSRSIYPIEWSVYGAKTGHFGGISVPRKGPFWGHFGLKTGYFGVKTGLFGAISVPRKGLFGGISSLRMASSGPI